MTSYPQEILGSANILVESLKTIYSAQESKIIVRWLVEATTKLDWVKICLEPNSLFTRKQAIEFQKRTKELLAGRPIQYVLGEAHFFEHIFKVNESVLIPRPETEELVDWIKTEFSDKSELQVLDIGTGSGCIPISLSILLEKATVTSVDISPAALKLAFENNQALGGSVTFKEMDILTANSEEFSELDLIVSNPPYVLASEKEQMHINVLEYEPELALFVPDTDALVFYRTILHLGRQWLKTGGWIYFEINEAKGPEMIALMEAAGYTHATVRKDLGERDRMARCQWLG